MLSVVGDVDNEALGDFMILEICWLNSSEVLIEVEFAYMCL